MVSIFQYRASSVHQFLLASPKDSMATRKDREEVLDEVEDAFRHDLPVHLYATHLLHRIDPLWPSRIWTSWPLPASRVPDPRTAVTYADNIVPEGFFDSDIDQSDSVPSDSNDDDDETNENQAERNANSDINSDSDSIWELDDDFEDLDSRELGLVVYKETLTNSKNNLLNEIAASIRTRIMSSALTLEKDNSNLFALPDVPDEFVTEASKEIANKVDSLIGALIQMQQRKDTPATLFNWHDVVLAALKISQTKDLGNLRYFYRKCCKLFEDNSFEYDFEDGSKLLGPEAVEKYYAELNQEEQKHFDDTKIKSWYFSNQKKQLIQNALRLKDHLNSVAPSKGTPHNAKRKRDNEPDVDSKRMVFEHGGFRLDEDEYVVRISNV